VSDEPKYRDEEWLREQYAENYRTTPDIAEECGCTEGTVSRWLERHDIETRKGGPRAPQQLRDEEWLREQYVKNTRSTIDIADECGCSDVAVGTWLSRHGIETRGDGYSPTPPLLKNKSWLQDQYVEKRRSALDIADELGCSDTTVGKWLSRHGIEKRDVTPSVTGPNHGNWEGGKFPYGRGWSESKRERVRDRDGRRCRGCGMTQTEHKAEYDHKLHVHHLIKARDIDDPEKRNAPENLITLCRDCHHRWERLSEAGIRPQIDGVTAD